MKRYRAFISYAKKDERWAKRLHRSLENYRIPLGILVDLPDPKRKLGRIFRDDDELAGATSLGAALEGALDDSENLIVVCSPSAVQSYWVNEEIRRFKTVHASDHIFAVIVGGRPHGTDDSGADAECFPPALRYRVRSDGSLSDEPDEPLAPDLRKESMSRVGARLSAGMLDINFDDLWQRDQRRRRKWTACLSLMAATIAGMFIWLVLTFHQQYQLSAASMAQSLIDEGDIEQAVTTLVDSIPLPVYATNWLTSSETTQALFHALLKKRLLGQVQFSGSNGADYVAAAVFPIRGTHRAVIALPSKSVYSEHALVNLEKRIVLSSFVSGDANLSNILISHETSRVLVLFDNGKFALWDTLTGKKLASIDVDPGEKSRHDLKKSCFDPVAGNLLIGSGDGILRIFDTRDGRMTQAIRAHQSGISSMECRPQVGFFTTNTVVGETKIWNASDLSVKRSIPIGGRPTIMAPYLSRDGARLLGWDQMGGLRLFDVDSGKQLGATINQSEDSAKFDIESFEVDPNEIRFVGRTISGWYGLYNARTAQFIKQLRAAEVGWDTSTTERFSRDGSRIVLENAKYGTVKVFDASDGRETLAVNNRAAASGTPDKTLAVYDTGTIELRNIQTGLLYSRLGVDAASIDLLKLSPSEDVIAALLSDRRIKLWKTDTLAPIATLAVPGDTTWSQLEFTDSSERLQVTIPEGLLKYDVAAYPKRYEIDPRLMDQSYCDFSENDTAEDSLFRGCLESDTPDAPVIFSIQGGILEWETVSDHFRSWWQKLPEDMLNQYSVAVVDNANWSWILFWKDGNSEILLVKQSVAGTYEITPYTQFAGSEQSEIIGAYYDHELDEVIAMLWNPSGVKVVRLNDTGNSPASRTTVYQEWEPYPFYRDGRMLAIIKDYKEESIYLWDFQQARRVVEYEDSAYLVDSCSPEGYRESDHVVFRCREHASMNPRRRNAYSIVHNMRTGKHEFETERFMKLGHARPVALSISDPATGPSVIKLINTESWQTVRTLLGHTGVVTSAEFLLHDRWIATAGRDGKLIFWDASTGSQFAWLPFGEPITLDRFGNDDNRIDLSIVTESGKMFRIDLEMTLSTLLDQAKAISYTSTLSKAGLP